MTDKLTRQCTRKVIRDKLKPMLAAKTASEVLELADKSCAFCREYECVDIIQDDRDEQTCPLIVVFDGCCQGSLAYGKAVSRACAGKLDEAKQLTQQTIDKLTDAFLKDDEEVKK